MKKKNQIETNLVKMENFLDYEKNIEVDNETFKKLMLIYSFAIKELETKIDIISQEYKNFYDYDNSRDCKDVKVLNYKHHGKIKFPISK